MARKTGNVKWFSNEKGYGFIEQEDGEDVFVHHSDIQGDGYKTLKQGEVVEYEIIKADKGPKAQRVVRGEDADADGDRPARRGSSTGNGDASAGAGGRETETEAVGRETEAESSLARQLRQKLSDRFLGGD